MAMNLFRMIRSQGELVRDIKYYVIPLLGVAALTLLSMMFLAPLI
jgi:hypothetical protein